MKQKLNNKQKITWRVRWEFKPQDCRLGIYWKSATRTPKWKITTDVWVCLLPCLPIHITHTREWADPAPKGMGESWTAEEMMSYKDYHVDRKVTMGVDRSSIGFPPAHIVGTEAWIAENPLALMLAYVQPLAHFPKLAEDARLLMAQLEGRQPLTPDSTVEDARLLRAQLEGQHFRAKLECVIKLSDGSEQRSSGIFESKDGVVSNVDQIVFPRVTAGSKFSIGGWVKLGPNHIPFVQDRLMLRPGDQIVIEPGQWSSAK